MPMTSMVASAVISPTSASTLEVPMSRPTMTCLSDFLAIDVRPCARRGARCRAPGQMSGAALPAHGKAVAVAHVDIGDVRGALTHELRGNRHEALEARLDLQFAEPQLHTVIQPQAQRAARIERHCDQTQSRLGESSLNGQIARGRLRFGAERT